MQQSQHLLLVEQEMNPTLLDTAIRVSDAV
jgi:hypothetical protein